MFKDDYSRSSRAGQFCMVWLPGVGEFPMSLSLKYARNQSSSIVVKAMGEGSRKLYDSKPGDLLGLRGPYGSWFSVPKRSRRALLVGGGTGMAPIMAAARELTESKIATKIVIGARTKKELPFLGTSRRMLGSGNVFPATDDGSLGFSGFAHELVEALVAKTRFDSILACGPEAMMLKVYKIAKERTIPVQFSLERIMKCGIAICGSCCVGDIVLCRDGPVLNDDLLSRIANEFGRFERDKSGRLVPKH